MRSKNFLIIIVLIGVVAVISVFATRGMSSESGICLTNDQCEFCQITYGGIVPPLYKRAECLDFRCQVCPPFGDVKKEISEEEAISIAMSEIESYVEVPSDSQPVVEFSNDTIIVTFPTNLPPLTLGPDYHAQVTIDRKIGEIIDVLVGS